MRTQNKLPIIHFVLTGTRAAVLATCSSSNEVSDPARNLSIASNNIDTGNTGKGNTDEGNTDKGNIDKDNTDKGNTDKGNTDKDNIDKGNTDKGNTDKGNTDKGNTDKGNKTNINKETSLLNKGIQDKLTTLKLGDIIKTEQFNQTGVNTGFIASNLGATPLLETAKGPHDYPTSHLLTSVYRKDKTKSLRPRTVILGGVATRYSTNYIDGYVVKRAGYDEIDTSLSTKNLIGVDKRNKNGILVKNSRSVNILDQTTSELELDSVGGSCYTKWFNNFVADADNETESDKGRRVLTDVKHKLDANNNLVWTVTTKPSSGYQYAHSLNRYFDNNPDDELYVNQDGEYVYRFVSKKSTIFEASIEPARTHPEHAEALKALGWSADKQYYFAPGSHFMVTQKDGSLKIIADNGQMTQVSLHLAHVGIDNNRAFGTFQSKRVTAEMFSALSHDKTNETRAIYTYNVGQVNGFDQQYPLLNVWCYKNSDSTYGLNNPSNIGTFDRATTENDTVANVYDVKTKRGLLARYADVAYPSRDGKQDDIMNMTVQFHEPDIAYDNTILSNNITFNGETTNRRLDDKRNAYLASGNVKIGSGMPSVNAGQKVSLVGRSQVAQNVTVWMEGKNPGENKVIYGQGNVRFAGPNAEEAGGLLKITTSHGENNIGSIGKR